MGSDQKDHGDVCAHVHTPTCGMGDGGAVHCRPADQHTQMLDHTINRETQRQERNIDRQTDGQTDRQTDRQANTD